MPHALATTIWWTVQQISEDRNRAILNRRTHGSGVNSEASSWLGRQDDG